MVGSRSAVGSWTATDTMEAPSRSYSWLLAVLAGPATQLEWRVAMISVRGAWRQLASCSASEPLCVASTRVGRWQEVQVRSHRGRQNVDSDTLQNDVRISVCLKILAGTKSAY